MGCCRLDRKLFGRHAMPIQCESDRFVKIEKSQKNFLDICITNAPIVCDLP